MKLDFNYNSVREVEVSVYQEPVGITSAILVMEQVSTMNTLVPAPQCITVLMCAPLPLQSPTVSAPLHFQSASIGAPRLVLGAYLPPGHRFGRLFAARARALITVQGRLSR